MKLMEAFVAEKVTPLAEDRMTVDGDLYDEVTLEVSPVNKRVVQRMMQRGEGLRILVGAGDLNSELMVWAGDGDSNIPDGATHDTVGSQFGMSVEHDGHVSLEMTKDGRLQVTTTNQRVFDDPRQIEDVLDRNREFQKVFGGLKVDMSKLSSW